MFGKQQFTGSSARLVKDEAEGSLGNYPGVLLISGNGVGTVLLRTGNSGRFASKQVTWSEWLLV